MIYLFLLFMLTTTILCEEVEFDDAFFTALENEPVDLLESDIIQKKSGGMSYSALSNHSTKWPNAKVYYLISPHFKEEERSKIIAAMQEIADKTCVRFLTKEKNHYDFIFILKGSLCASFVGRAGGRQKIFLGENCLSERRVILHEFMHALGFIHEHNRSDRDDFVTINWGNIPKDKKHNFEKRQAGDLDLLNTEYHYNSIMHYTGQAFAINSKFPTIVPGQEGVKLGGEKDRLSDVDVLRIKRRYCEAPKISWFKRSDGIEWALHCDIPHNDIKKFSAAEEQCVHLCIANPNCDHFAWSTLNGGTCWLKKGYNPKKVIGMEWSRGRICGFKYATVVTLYKHHSFIGYHEDVAMNSGQCYNLEPSMNDIVTSVNTRGSCVIVCQHVDCKGRCVKLMPECGTEKDCCSNYNVTLSTCDFNDRTSSLKIC